MASVKDIVTARVTKDTTRAELAALAAELGRSVRTIEWWASALGLRNPRPDKLPRIGVVLDYLRAGDSPRRIARRHGVTKQAVYRCLTRSLPLPHP